ncbi:hypothetical protein OG2516_02414 [Oceanicola granulosus HTCC2516]|uniref:HTH lacI-type domain-containing protein n=1 Tax=Oceanicola granulosus (strain ATCC BAA-861 / DSM 15982 / KCTC 12143 / HTCC2516) TaxID=314256 RepID=Q2CHP1_OCEGH|nr:substrate-binding domain-containing protein [Oceanicola granulosus]EAR52253.1 hypothetical protein OG2516_02414 [Oceanicola granulosus HTCC2516]
MNLKQLAEALGLSQTTVSRALNGYPEVSEATRRRVVEAAAQHGYSPNARAKGLATGQAMAIGLVIPVSDQQEMVNPVFGDFLAGAGEACSALGYEMVLSVVEGDEAAVYRSMKARGSVDGVVVSAPRLGDPRPALLDGLGLPFLVHGRISGYEAPYSWIDVNSRSAFRRAAGFLLDLGHRRVGLVNGEEIFDFAHRRRRGYGEALAERGLPETADLVVQGEMTEDFGHDSARAMLARPDPPTAFLVSSLICALGVRRAVEELGLVMGRDVSIVTHDDALSYFQNGGDVPIFTAVRSSVREAGRRAARLLIGRIETPGAPHAQDLLEAQLLVGESTGPAPRARKTAP